DIVLPERVFLIKTHRGRSKKEGRCSHRSNEMHNTALSRKRYDHYAGANIEIPGRNASGFERERCRLRSSGAAKQPKAMSAGPLLFTSHGGNLCIWHK